jgi:dTDP-4-dehydrorhamnose reductase
MAFTKLDPINPHPPVTRIRMLLSSETTRFRYRGSKQEGSQGSRMKILFYGSNGWIGSQFFQYFKEQDMDVSKGVARLDNEEDVENEIRRIQPTHVVSFIGRTYGTYKGEHINTIDYLEKPGVLKENIRDNMYGPVYLGLLSMKYNFHYTYLGTGCIFNYDSLHPFEEETNGFTSKDKPNYFGSSYSIVKGYVDRLFHHIPVLNLRIRMPITAEENPRNFITKITRYAKICSIKNSMTVLPDFFPVIVSLMENHVKETVNLTNPGLISHNEILEMYKEIVDPGFTWVNFTQEEQAAILLAERSNNYLDTSYIEEHFNVPTIRDSVRSILGRYASSLVR